MLILLGLENRQHNDKNSTRQQTKGYHQKNVRDVQTAQPGRVVMLGPLSGALEPCPRVVYVYRSACRHFGLPCKKYLLYTKRAGDHQRCRFCAVPQPLRRKRPKGSFDCQPTPTEKQRARKFKTSPTCLRLLGEAEKSSGFEEDAGITR